MCDVSACMCVYECKTTQNLNTTLFFFPLESMARTQVKGESVYISDLGNNLILPPTIQGSVMSKRSLYNFHHNTVNIIFFSHISFIYWNIWMEEVVYFNIFTYYILKCLISVLLFVLERWELLPVRHMDRCCNLVLKWLRSTSHLCGLVACWPLIE